MCFDERERGRAACARMPLVVGACRHVCGAVVVLMPVNAHVFETHHTHTHKTHSQFRSVYMIHDAELYQNF